MITPPHTYYKLNTGENIALTYKNPSNISYRWLNDLTRGVASSLGKLPLGRHAVSFLSHYGKCFLKQLRVLPRNKERLGPKQRSTAPNTHLRFCDYLLEVIVSFRSTALLKSHDRSIHLFLTPTSSDSFITFFCHLKWTQELKINKLVPPLLQIFSNPLPIPHFVSLLSCYPAGEMLAWLSYFFPSTFIFLLLV